MNYSSDLSPATCAWIRSETGRRSCPYPRTLGKSGNLDANQANAAAALAIDFAESAFRQGDDTVDLLSLIDDAIGIIRAQEQAQP